MTGRLTLITLAGALAMAQPAAAQRFMYTGVPDAEVISFLGRLQKAVGAGDRAGVAAMVRYPLRVNRDASRHVTVASAADLLKQYDAVFTPTIRQAILSEKPATLTGGKDGVAIKAGLVWVTGTCDTSRPPKCKLGVSSVNLHGET